MNFVANYQALSLTGNGGIDYLGNGISGSVVHQVFCLSTGVITLQAFGGGMFNFSANTGQSIDIVLRSYTAITGSFIGFKAKYYPHQSVTNY